MEEIRVFNINIIEVSTGNVINNIYYNPNIADNVNTYFDELKTLVEKESDMRLTIKLKELSICTNIFNILRDLGIKSNNYLLKNLVVK